VVAGSAVPPDGAGRTDGAGGCTGSAGPALALTSAVNGPRPEPAVTSEISPTTAHRTSRAP
jgi:hypothetical protein